MQANGQRQYGTKYLRCLYAADLYKINTNFMPGEPFVVDVAIMGGVKYRWIGTAAVCGFCGILIWFIVKDRQAAFDFRFNIF